MKRYFLMTFMLILQFVFKVLPIIVPFNFGEEELNLDESVSTMCSITKGDLPIQIWWTFSGDREEFSYNISSNDGLMITRNSQKLSILAIEAVKARHRGNYTCFASNKGGTTQHSAHLAFNGSLEL
jgi:hypothetical protein